MPEEDQKQSKELPESEGEIKPESTSAFQICSHCGEKSPEGTIFCGHCGKPFKEKIPCPGCGKEIPVYYSFCTFCGAVVKPSFSPRQQETSTAIVQTAYKPPHPTSITSYQQIPQQLRIEEFERQQQQIKIASRLTSARIVGIIALVFAAFNLLSIILTIPLLYSDSYFQDILNDAGLSMSVAIASILAVMLPIIIILVVMGISLIKPKEYNRPWKSLYQNFRYLFLSFSVFLAALIFLIVISWSFYFPKSLYTDPELFWLFKVFLVPLNANISVLYLIDLFGFIIATILLILPTVVVVIKKKIKHQQDEQSKKEEQEEELGTGKLAKQFPGNIPGTTQQTQIRLAYKSRKEQLQAAKARKGPMPIIFERIKNVPLIQTIELLGAMSLVSIILVQILAPKADESIGLPEDPFKITFQVGWAGIFEELSFRLILIGGPMIIVIISRYFLQKHLSQKILVKNPETTIPITQESLLIKSFKNQPKLGLKDILLAFRGKYKIVGLPEWILIFFSSLIFGFAHWEAWTGSWGAWKIVQASVSGFFLSYAFVKYGIESSIFIHFCSNTISALIYYAPKGGAEWLGVFAAGYSFLILLVGLMKGVSFIINQVYVHHIVYQPPQKY
ncbi:MAG: double zinc ribbon domain-containing protein [Candidatus Heimdallarchaeota archaeon]